MKIPNVVALLAENHPLAVVLTDAGGRILYANRAFEAMCGYNAREYTGNKPSFLQGKKTNKITASQMGQKIGRNEKFTVRLLNYHKDGHPYFVDIFCFPIRNLAGDVEYIMSLEQEVKPKAGRRKVQEQTSDIPHWAREFVGMFPTAPIN